MKNFTLGLNIVLAVAVAVLFYLYFSSSKSTGGGNSSSSASVADGNFKIAYFEIDSVQEHFEYFKTVRSELESKGQANSRVLGELKNTFTNKYQELQRIAGQLSQAELAHKEQELMQIEKAFQGKEKMMSDEMQEETFRRMMDVKKKIEDYLKQYNSDKGYAYIFSNSPDLIYLKDGHYDITADLIKGLNTTYPAKK